MAVTTVTELLDFFEAHSVEYLDMRFTDLRGTEHALTIPANTFTEASAAAGFAFDGSSIDGFTTINEPDMILRPDISTAYIDPFRAHKTVNMKFFVHKSASDGASYPRDPRSIARRAEEYLQDTGIADTCYIGCEAEFFVFDSVRYSTSVNTAFHHVDSDEGWWRSGEKAMINGDLNRGNQIQINDGRFPVAPYDKTIPVRDEVAHHLTGCGFAVERFHHEIATGGAQKVKYRFNTLLAAGDDLQTFKYIVKNTAESMGRTATFMPMPLEGDRGCGMHTHQSLWKEGEPLFDGEGCAGLSDLGRWYIGGLLKHAGAVMAFTNPTANSYRRLYSGVKAPINLAYSESHSSTAIRIPAVGNNPDAKRLEFRAPDPSGNPYLGFAAQLLAGLDGIQNQIDPGNPVDFDSSDSSSLPDVSFSKAKAVAQVPYSLERSLEALDNDREFLTRTGVFNDSLLDAHIQLKYDEEIMPLRKGPTPKEFELYYNV
ncbi:type I glutamate--ammonia ligase [Corynebacterium pseudodiphtheriticum]|uniref:type I glutamate--ammonia ligase n=1 Tax=Corynebacterium pseudodiphtheriticum TaxID=37637 RepID=UPI00254E7802|nr:type I glutamate--ammonia ligase [Corynebacterium pseudodiphtheriticum]MDK8479000.1 type I glutamate--ammonia ligase [Corynebacterium pseudodiphtheriticum]MDK8486695.1 type I glutamate--ammonia ligase [Corynebacterium pseudodiphtheriticum]MDK8493792.1 type I glutamate--ammonia ligase [Corynebacterium pseudodiphtheriticum]MDK8500279.1 type I glutamate--ammonia ligase [Corynebacterium pseudodiphtheriticum]MDK8563305.1 type I glutamate--ammonia ligase [Corynebacterium pseudodiphtheriticum]